MDIPMIGMIRTIILGVVGYVTFTRFLQGRCLLMWNRLDFILPETLCIEKDYGDIFIRNMLVLMQCTSHVHPK